MKRVSVFLIVVALVAGMVGCEPTPQYDLTIASTEGGDVTTPGEGIFTYDEGTVVNLTAEAEEGYRFINWTGDVGTLADINAAATNITIFNSYNITANFEEIPEYDLTIFSTTGGNVTTPGEGVFTYDEGIIVNLVAEAEGCYRFVNWTGDVATVGNITAATTTITMDDVYSITANFEEETVVFPDIGLETAIREAIANPDGPIYTCDLKELTSLDARHRSIADLAGLEYCINLTNLNLEDNQINDISPFADLRNLKELGLGVNQLIDVSPLVNLTNLTLLGLENNQIIDILPMANLINLTNLGLKNNQIANISPLANLINLTRLDLRWNQLSNISAVANLTSLQELGFSYNQISDISAVGNLTNLTLLGLNHNDISDISAVANLTNLTRMSLGHNQISDVSPLANLTSLTWLSSPYNEISNISAVGNLTNLQDLDFANNQISDVEPLVDNSGLSDGDDVYLTDNPLSSDSINTYIPQLEARGVTVYY